ncbi:MAG: nucleotide exchange factor GrpE [Rhodobacteraceae bacterium]|nr:nucleotide exchange factor GrpE [Paracoccaceae bacterium]
MAKEEKDIDVDLERFLKENPAPDEEKFQEDELIDIDASSEEVDPIAALEEEVATLKDRLIRSLAESENLRKRGERECREAEVYGGQKLARDLLSVYDNLARALETIEENQREAHKALIDGIELTQKELISTFKKHRITKIVPERGDKFDPKLHQAMFEAPVPDVAAGHIIQVMQEGFMIGDRLLRPVQVGVSSGNGG